MHFTSLATFAKFGSCAKHFKNFKNIFFYILENILLFCLHKLIPFKKSFILKWNVQEVLEM